MPTNFAVDGLPIPHPREPRIFALPTEVEFEDSICDIVENDFARDGALTLSTKLGSEHLHAPAGNMRVHHSASLPVYDSPLDEPPVDTYDGFPMDMAMSPAAMFLSAFSPPSIPTVVEEDVNPRIDGYAIGPVIGHGGFSVVHRASSPSGDVVAVKIIHHKDVPDETARQRLSNEAVVWATLSHEHILPLFHATHTPSSDYFFMPLCPAGSLFDILRRDGQPGLPHDDAGMMFRQVVRGVRYLHEQAELVHGDLKLENVLVDASGSCRISDFGMAHPISHEAAPVRRQRSLIVPNQRGHAIPSPVSRFRAHHSGTRHRVSSPLPTNNSKPALQAVYELPQGSLPYAAPELLRVPSPDAPYIPDPAQDVWALGVMLHALLTGRLPFWDSFEPRLTMKILKGFDSMPENIGRGAELVLRGCLTFEPHRRWTIAAVDEIAWSVGWGADALIDDDIERMIEESLAPPSRAQSASRSRSRAPDVIYEDDDECAASTFDGPLVASPIADRFAHIASAVSRSSSSSSSPYATRGRAARTGSRSPSPSVPPATPTDRDRLADRFVPFALAHSPGPRGRKARPRSAERPAPYHLPPLERQPHSFAHAPPRRLERSRSREGRRAGSQPPANSTPWTLGVLRIQQRASATVAVSPSLTPAEGRFVIPRAGHRRSASVDVQNRRPREVAV